MSQPIFLVGPTGAGKTSVSLKLAKTINAEIVSADSMQVYIGMDIGTAKPSLLERKSVPHYLIDILDLNREYDVASFVGDANKAIDTICKGNKIPLVVGGTGLYIKALTDGLFEGPSASVEIREKLEKRIEEEGLISLYKELVKVDSVSAGRIEQNDKRRIIRALEVFYLTGSPISLFQTQWKEEKEVCLIGLNRDREDLYERINLRVEEMFNNGFIDEVKRLKIKGLEDNKTARQALGYKEILEYLNDKYTIDETKELIKRNTRHFAKRQLTWFNKDARVKWIYIKKDENIDSIVDKIISCL